MKLFRNQYRLLNAAEELSSEGSEQSESVNVNDMSVDEFASSEDAIFSDLGIDPTKYGITKDQEAPPSEDPQGSEEVQEQAGQAIDEKSYLEWINSLGAVHNETPLKVESVDEIKNLIQMGKDYTVKTQSLSEERKAWESERVSAENEINGAIEELNKTQTEIESKIQELQQWNLAFDKLKNDAPDVFEEVQRTYKEVERHFKNPILDQQLQAMNKRLQDAESQLKTREDKAIIDGFEREFSGLKALEQSLSELGVKLDKEAIKKEWAETGLDVKKVVGSMYFEQIAKAQASKSKVESTATKLAAKPTGVAASSRPGKAEYKSQKTLNPLDHAMDLARNKYGLNI